MQFSSVAPEENGRKEIGGRSGEEYRKDLGKKGDIERGGRDAIEDGTVRDVIEDGTVRGVIENDGVRDDLRTCPVPIIKVDRGYGVGGCTGRTGRVSKIYGDKIYYACGRAVLCEGKIYLPNISSKITSMEVNGKWICVESASKEICVIDRDSRVLFEDKSDTFFGGVAITESEVLYQKNNGFCMYGMENGISCQAPCGKFSHINAVASEKTSEEKPRVVYVVLGTYEGEISVVEIDRRTEDRNEAQNTDEREIGNLNDQKGPEGCRAREAKITPELQNLVHLETVLKGKALHILATFTSGKCAVCTYSTESREFEKKEIISISRHSHVIAKWAGGACDEILTASENGTASVWKYDHANKYWETKEMHGGQGGLPITNAFLSSKREVFLQTRTGGVSRAGVFSSSGHTGAVRSLEVLGPLLITSSQDSTVRVFRVSEKGEVAEVFRPLVSGHEMYSADFLEDGVVASAADENILRIHTETSLYRKTVGKEEKKGLPYTAVQQELSLTTIPHTPAEEDQKQMESAALADSLMHVNAFCEHQRVYGFPFQIREMKCIRGRAVLIGCHASQKQFAALYVVNKRYRIVQKLEIHVLGIRKIAISPCGEFAVTAGRDRRVSLLRITRGRGKFAAEEVLPAFEEEDTGVKLADLREDHTREILSVCFSSDSARFFSASKDRKVITYRIEGDRLVMEETETVQEVVTSLYHEGTLFKGTVKGDVVAGGNSHRLHNSPVTQISSVEVGGTRYLVTATEDGVIRTDFLTWGC